MSSPNSAARVLIPPKLLPIFQPERGELRYRGAYGGRGSGKSFTFAKMAAIWGYREPLRILCTREFQNSIRQSFYAELKQAIESEPWLAAGYDIGENYLRGKNGTEFIFKGLKQNISAIKSLAKIDLCIVEEAEDISENGWIELEPTIREPKSELWIIYNPKVNGSPTDTRFRKNTPPRSRFAFLNYPDNPWFPKELEEQRQHAQKTLDPGTYAHIWEGAYFEKSDAQVFRDKYRIVEFEPDANWSGPYQGLDFGFSQDPTAAVRCWIHQHRLYIEYEAGRTKLELDATGPFVKKHIPGFETFVTRADNARPESISYLQRNGLKRLVPCQKGKGSVEDGIEFIRSFYEVVIHPRCRQTIDEFRLYSYKVDKMSGDVLPVLIDANNHYIDAIRYALEPLTRNKRKIIC